MMLETTLRLLTGLLLIAANAFFVATEFALTRVRQYDKSEFQSHPGLRRAWKMTEELEIYLTGCQVGITFTSILLGIIVEPAMTKVVQPLLTLIGVGEPAAHAVGFVVGLVLVNLAHTIWAEQTPTYLGIEKSKLVAKYCAIPHFWWTRLVYPLLYVGDAMAKGTLRMFKIEMKRSWTDSAETNPADTPAPPTRGELIQQMGSLLKRGRLSADRRNEILQAVRIEEIPVRQAMVPREQIVALSAEESFAESVRKVGDSKHTRYPWIGSRLEDFRGIVYLPEMFAQLDDLLDQRKTLADVAVRPMTVPHDLTVSELIDSFQHQNQELALVTENEKIVGLVTLTDALEVIVGQSADPLDLLVAEDAAVAAAQST